MAEGEIWVVRDSQYAKKARPAIIVQSNHLAVDSVVVVMTTSERNANVAERVELIPAAANGLLSVCYAMADKPSALPRQLLGKKIGEVSPNELEEIRRALASTLGITTSILG